MWFDEPLNEENLEHGVWFDEPINEDQNLNETYKIVVPVIFTSTSYLNNQGVHTRKAEFCWGAGEEWQTTRS